MDITFLNGTGEQHQVVNDAVHDLLHLDPDTCYPFPWDIDFIPNPVSDPTIHHPFAVTELTAGHPVTHFRDDFPRFAPTDSWGSLAFARETVIHELGHAAEANLATDVQESVAALFGTDQANLYPTDRTWEDRPGEGMAETFKDAFLPQSDRQYSNRTRVSIPIPKYPEFRRLFRTGTEGAGGSPDVDIFLQRTASEGWSLGSPSDYQSPERGLESARNSGGGREYPDKFLAGSLAVLGDDATAGLFGLTADGPMPAVGEEWEFTLTFPSQHELLRYWTGLAYVEWDGATAWTTDPGFLDLRVLSFDWQVITYDPTNGVRFQELVNWRWAINVNDDITDTSAPAGRLYTSVTASLLDFAGASGVDLRDPPYSLTATGPGESLTWHYTVPDVTLLLPFSLWTLDSATGYEDETAPFSAGPSGPVNLGDVFANEAAEYALQPRLHLAGTGGGGTAGTPTPVPNGNVLGGQGANGARRHPRLPTG